MDVNPGLETIWANSQPFGHDRFRLALLQVLHCFQPAIIRFNRGYIYYDSAAIRRLIRSMKFFPLTHVPIRCYTLPIQPFSSGSKPFYM